MTNVVSIVNHWGRRCTLFFGEYAQPLAIAGDGFEGPLACIRHGQDGFFFVGDLDGGIFRLLLQLPPTPE